MSIPGRDVADIRPGTWPEPWQGRAACLGVPLEVFFLDAPASARAFDHAREICAACPVIAECRVMTDRAERGMSHSRLYRFVGGETPVERVRRRRAGGSRATVRATAEPS
jgi:hypothetical protein